MVELNSLHKRILEISKKHKLSHIGSSLTSVDIIDDIYSKMKYEDKFILSMGHAGLALYVVIEKYLGVNAETIYLNHGVHPERCGSCGITCSTGSLGCGLPIALGMAIADRRKTIYCLISDGEATEGAIWEVANIMRKFKVENLVVYLNYNGYSAYDEVDEKMIENVKIIMPSINIVKTCVEDYGLKGLSAHYITI